MFSLWCHILPVQCIFLFKWTPPRRYWMPEMLKISGKSSLWNHLPSSRKYGLISTLGGGVRICCSHTWHLKCWKEHYFNRRGYIPFLTEYVLSYKCRTVEGTRGHEYYILNLVYCMDKTNMQTPKKNYDFKMCEANWILYKIGRQDEIKGMFWSRGTVL